MPLCIYSLIFVSAQTLELKWTELKDINALDLAEQAECKDFYSHTFVQRYLDEVK